MAPHTATELLVVGAGPFGLAMAAQARHLNIDHLVVGQPMGFWRTHMPAGMYLRSACDWHLDPQGVDTIDAFLRTQALTPRDVEPLSLARYLAYTQWFQTRKRIEPRPALVERLEGMDGGGHRFRATLSDGGTIDAASVVLAIGFEYFKNVPDDLRELLPDTRLQHTCDLVDFTKIGGRRCLIIGGRQSAFEWAALMAEAGAAAVHVVHRHDRPAFAEADWSWVNALVAAMLDNPSWYRELSPVEKEDVGRRLWAEGRLKLEPWLASRVRQESVVLWPNTRVSRCLERADGALDVTLDGPAGSDAVVIDDIVLATGYKVKIAAVPLLARGNLLPALHAEQDLPVLDQHLQSSIPGLFITSMAATRDFGPFFAFTVAARLSARLIGRALRPS